ncbi:hypothetical protein GDO86_015829 [Hymenochirus boettgeri]|uniref:mRNA decay activator protein ZFP36 n=1 Tax=Hymenochirus boettgeri TaxID=247094 RepID=A0A8T2JUJ8_9PIPI|nr:hypothetical protein GDO86_015829 [Hymenochirus boettgeri]
MEGQGEIAVLGSYKPFPILPPTETKKLSSTMLSSLLSPFPELDANLSKEFMSLLSQKRFNAEGQKNNYLSCPVNLNREKSLEQFKDLSVHPLDNEWIDSAQLNSSNALRRIPFLADRSVSMIEDNRSLQLSPKPLSSRYKTELCRTFHEVGSCKYGSKCQFAHGSEELRGLNRHPKYKTELCRTYHTIGFCPYGSRCHFIHNAEEQRFISREKGQRPHLLRHSISCSGLPSSVSSDSLFSTSLSPFSPASPSFSPSVSLFSSSPSSPNSSPLTLNLSPFFHTVSPPSPTLQSSLSVGALTKKPPYRRSESMTESVYECFAHKKQEISEPKDCKSSYCTLSETKRLPIFSCLSD